MKDTCRQKYFQGFWEEKSVRQLLLGEEVGTFLLHLLPGRPDRMALAHVSSSGLSNYLTQSDKISGVTQHRIIFTKDGHVRLEDEAGIKMEGHHGQRSPRTSVGAGGSSGGSSAGIGEEANISLSAPVALPEESGKPEIFSSLQVRLLLLCAS